MIKESDKKVMIIFTLFILILVIVNITVKHENDRKQQQMVASYKECLKDNFNQRDYCAKLQGTDYRVLDQLVENN